VVVPATVVVVMAAFALPDTVSGNVILLIYLLLIGAARVWLRGDAVESMIQHQDRGVAGDLPALSGRLVREDVNTPGAEFDPAVSRDRAGLSRCRSPVRRRGYRHPAD
jgi:hypothetical protein